jgi:hypothetical protein
VTKPVVTVQTDTSRNSFKRNLLLFASYLALLVLIARVYL